MVRIRDTMVWPRSERNARSCRGLVSLRTPEASGLLDALT